jgi:signal transduction histidine kinase
MRLPRFLRWSAYRLRTKGLIVVGLPLLPLAAFWLVSVFAVTRQDVRPTNTEARSLVVQASLARVFSDLLDADAGARNFLLTGSRPGYQRYEAALGRLAPDLSALDSAVIDTELRTSLNVLQEAVYDEIAVLGRMTGAPPPGFPAMGEVAVLNRSVANLEKIRDLSAAMQGRQAALAEAQMLQDYRRRLAYFFAFLVGSFICAAAGVMAALMLANGVSRRASSLAKNADRLAHGLPPEPLPVGEDEIGLVDARLREAARLLGRRETELRERTSQLETANRELEAFSYSVSHDLRAPLRAIDGFSDALESDCAAELTDGAKDSLRRIRAAAKRMGTLIDELLALGRLGRTELVREDVDLSATAATIAADLARNQPQRKVYVTIASKLTVRADPELLRIVLHNLLDNAWKYTGKTLSARVEVGALMNGGVEVFHVRDNGAGFDMAHAHRLFGPFQRLHPERDFEGIGIGLATVQRIVRRHGGRIWAEGAVGSGATFYFTLEPEPVQAA